MHSMAIGMQGLAAHPDKDRPNAKIENPAFEYNVFMFSSFGGCSLNSSLTIDQNFAFA